MTDRIGQQLANYRLISILGQGGFADVYLGEHIYLNTLAAIKVLQMRLTDEDKQSFLEEARTIAHLKHPSIVRILEYDVGYPIRIAAQSIDQEGFHAADDLRKGLAPG